MIRKFECKNCGHHFEADDQQWVECPECHSDNVGFEEHKYHLPKLPAWAGKAAIALAALIVLSVGGYFLYQYMAEEPEEVTEEQPASVDEFDDKVNEEYDGPLAPRMVVGEKEYDEKTGTYSFDVHVDFPPKDKWRIDICEFRTQTAVASSENGKFEGVPYSKNDLGQYTFRLVNAETGELLTEELDLVGFDKLVTIKKPWTAAQLEKAINNYKVPLVDSPYISDQCEITVTNTSKDNPDMSDTSTFTSIQQRIEMNVKGGVKCSVKVLNVEIDDMNRIKAAQIKINEEVEDWMMEDE